MRRRRSILGPLSAILLIAVSGPLQAGEPPAEALPLIHTLCLSEQARRAIDSDHVLGTLGLEVKVQNGVAEVFGLVPTVQVGRQAVAKVAAVNGINEVRPNLFLKETRCQADVPTCIKAGKTDSSVDTSMKLRPMESGLVKNPEGRKARVDHPSARAGPKALDQNGDRQAGVRLLAPRQNNDKSLTAKIADLRERKAAYRPIRITLKGNDITVHRTNGSAESVNAFYRALQGIPGVGEVLLASD